MKNVDIFVNFGSEKCSNHKVTPWSSGVDWVLKPAVAKILKWPFSFLFLPCE